MIFQVKILEYLVCMIFQVCCTGHEHQLLQPEKPRGWFWVNFYLKFKSNQIFVLDKVPGKKLCFKILSFNRIFLSDFLQRMVLQNQQEIQFVLNTKAGTVQDSNKLLYIWYLLHNECTFIVYFPYMLQNLFRGYLDA